MKEIELLIKKEEISGLLAEVYVPELKFFDRDSDKMLDEKIEVLKALKSGKSIGEIPNFYDILELMPKDGMWD
jgi:hypothetical protein